MNISGWCGGAWRLPRWRCNAHAPRLTLRLCECRTAERYKQFFGVVPDAEIKAEADKLKQRGDFTDPPDTAKDNQVSWSSRFPSFLHSVQGRASS